MGRPSLPIIITLTCGFIINPALINYAQAESDGRAAVRRGDGGVVVNSFNSCVRTKWSAAEDPCAPPAPPPAPPPPPRLVIASAERTVYFNFNEAKLTLNAIQILDSLAIKLKADTHIKQARVVGFADRIGSDADNEKLSERRAGAVHDYLISRGFARVGATETRWLGESTPATQCPEGIKRPELIACLAKDRRVEVEIDYLTEVPATQ